MCISVWHSQLVTSPFPGWLSASTGPDPDEVCEHWLCVMIMYSPVSICGWLAGNWGNVPRQSPPLVCSCSSAETPVTRFWFVLIPESPFVSSALRNGRRKSRRWRTCWRPTSSWWPTRRRSSRCVCCDPLSSAILRGKAFRNRQD